MNKIRGTQQGVVCVGWCGRCGWAMSLCCCGRTLAVVPISSHWLCACLAGRLGRELEMKWEDESEGKVRLASHVGCLQLGR